MADTPKVSVLLELIDRLSAPINGIEGRIKSFGDKVSSLGKVIAATFTAAAAGKFFKDSVEAYLESEQSVARLSTALKGLGIAYKDVAPEVENTLKKIQASTKFGDEDAREALTRLVAITGNYGQSVKDLGLVADVAAFKQISMSDAADIVGKVHGGNTKILREFGISATGASDGLEKLRTVTGGFAEKEGQTLGGLLSQLKNQWGEFQESVGGAIANNEEMRGVIGGLAQTMADLAAWVDTHSEQIATFAKFVVGVATAAGNLLGMALEGFQRIGERLGLVEVEGTKVVTREETARSRAVQASIAAQGTARVTQTKQQLADEEAARKKSHETLLAMEKEAHDATLTTLDMMGKGYAAIMMKMWDKVESLRGDDKAKGIKAIEEIRDAFINDWVGGAVPAIKKTEEQVGRFHLALDGTRLAIPEAIEVTDDYIRSVTGLTRAEWENWHETERRKRSIEDTADAIVAGTRKAQDVAHNLASVFGEDVVSAVDLVANSVATMADGLKDVMSGDWIGGISKGVGAAVSLVKGLFGKSAAEKKLEETLAKNTAKLEEHRRTMGDLIHMNATGNQIAGVQDVLKQFFAGGGAAKKGWGDRLGNLLLNKGLTMDDVDALAKTLGIELRPNGHLDPTALSQLFQGLGLVEPTKFRNTFADQRTRIETGVSIGAITDPIGEVVKLMGDKNAGSPAIAAALAGLDLSTAGGKSQGIQHLQDLFSNVGNLSAADLGGLTGADFLDAIQWLIGLLQDAKDAPNAPTGGTDTGSGSGGGTDGAGAGTGTGAGGTPAVEPRWQSSIVDMLDVATASRDYLMDIRDAVQKSTAPDYAAALTASLQTGDINVTVVGGADPASTGTAIATATVDALDEQLAQLRIAAQIRTGSAVRS